MNVITQPGRESGPSERAVCSRGGGLEATEDVGRRPGWLLRQSLLSRLWDPETAQHQEWLAHKFKSEGGERYASVSWGGVNPSIGHGMSPIENTIMYESWDAGRREYKRDPRIESFGEEWECRDAKAARLHLALTEELRPLEREYWMLRSGENLMSYLVGAVEAIENHIWRWMARGEMSEDGFEEQALRLMDAQLGESRRKLRDGVAAIMRVAPILDDPAAVRQLRLNHVEISGEMNAMHEAMDALFRMLSEFPTTIKGVFKWIEEVNTIRRSVGLRVMPTPFGMKRLGKRAAMRARRVAVKAMKAFSMFAAPSDVKALTEGGEIRVQTTDGWLEFRISMIDLRREVMEDGELIAVELSGLMAIPNIKVHTRDGAFLANVCV